MNRRGFTLVEMVVAIAVSSVLMGAATVMLVAMLKNEGSSRRHLEFCTILNRLDEQFRADVHAAVSSNPDKSGEVLELVSPGSGNTLVRYRCQPKEITREEIEGEKILRRESYVLPEEVKTSFDQKSEGTISTLTLLVELKPLPGTKIRYPVSNIEALLAKDHRFEQAETKK
jgi:prepilin-type N-terminal cleavage/methylation domain-containing protein